ncbi:MAG TPA: efflux RND transporter periplasmic adaptor subunit [Puia sp.]|jgi:membrane fusion protein (multidrug efflux system)|nr:efflux RND transporter periplasmic adaptor subunit [Puia sp.]
MHKILTVVMGASLLLSACGSSSVKNDNSLAGKKARLADLKTQQEKLAKQISSLEDSIGKLDTTAAAKEKAKLVALTPMAAASFIHYIDLQGDVEAENYSNVSPQGNGGIVKEVLVKLGDHVTKGQLLLRLDDAVQRQNVANAQVAVAHAQDLYQRRKNLWDEKIGTEVDLINAKNQLDQSQIQLKIAQEQLGWTNVYADIQGTVTIMNVKTGQMFSAATQAGNSLQILNTDNLKVVVQVPELYQERVRVGTPVKIGFPGLGNKEIVGTVHITSPVISTTNRTFQVEIRIPQGGGIRSNQVALVKLEDYKASNALIIPINTLQTDEKGKYVMVAARDKDKIVAHKKSITIGQTYADKVEVTGGLQPGDQLITDGFQGLYEGQLITTE